MITTGVMFGLGDMLAQRLFPPTKDFESTPVAESRTPIVAAAPDKQLVPGTLSLATSSFSNFINSPSETSYSFDHLRSMRAVIYGSLFFAPIVVVWQGRLLPRVVNPFIRATTRSTMNPRRLLYLDTGFRVLVDQLIMPGFIFIPLYNTVMITLAMHDNPIEKIKEKLRNGWWKVLRASWVVWPSFHFVSLLFVPIHMRIVAANFWSVGWNCFLSFCHNTKGHGKGSGHKLEEFMDIDGVDASTIALVD